MCSIEVESAAKEGELIKALRAIELEDPTFHVHEDDETGQIVMYGMGELHLEVITQRLKTDFNQDVKLGRYVFEQTLPLGRGNEKKKIKSSSSFGGGSF